MSKIYENTKQYIESRGGRISAWRKGVNEYALEIAESLDEMNAQFIDKATALNGASSWSEYSYGGCSLIYNSDIAERLCSPSGLKRSRGGERNPNARESWLDCQARALCQAFNIVKLANRS